MKDLEKLANFSIAVKTEKFSSLLIQIDDISTVAIDFGSNNKISEN